MNNYKDKYLKYKAKYLEFKNNSEQIQIGGGKKIFDLNKKYPDYKKGELQNNLINFEKKYGKNFKIKYNDILINVVLEKANTQTDLTFYRMTYDIPKRNTRLLPFKIDFIDPILVEKNNNTYIANIQKTDKISGSNMTKICLEINRILGAEKTSLGDGTKVNCDKTNEKMDLSYVKLIEKGMTFYMSLGFDFYVDEKIQYSYPLIFSDKNKFKKEINKIIYNIRNIETQDIIEEFETTMELLNKIIKNDDEKNLEIIFGVFNPTHHDLITWYNNFNIKELMNESIDVLKILHKYKNYKKFYKILIKLFKDACNEYNILYKYIVSNERYKIVYKKTIIVRDYIKDFGLLKSYRNTYSYVYNF